MKSMRMALMGLVLAGTSQLFGGTDEAFSNIRFMTAVISQDIQTEEIGAVPTDDRVRLQEFDLEYEYNTPEFAFTGVIGLIPSQTIMKLNYVGATQKYEIDGYGFGVSGLYKAVRQDKLFVGASGSLTYLDTTSTVTTVIGTTAVDTASDSDTFLGVDLVAGYDFAPGQYLYATYALVDDLLDSEDSDNRMLSVSYLHTFSGEVVLKVGFGMDTVEDEDSFFGKKTEMNIAVGYAF